MYLYFRLAKDIFSNLGTVLTKQMCRRNSFGPFPIVYLHLDKNFLFLRFEQRRKPKILKRVGK